MKKNLFNNYLKKQVFEEEEKYIDLLNDATKILNEEKIKFNIKDLEQTLERIAEEKKQDLLLSLNNINISDYKNITEDNKMLFDGVISEILLLKLKEKI